MRILSIAALLATLGLTVTLAGCGDGSGEANSSGNGAGSVEIRYTRWGLPEEIESERELLKEFEKANPDIKVKLEYSSWSQYWNKLQAQLAARQAPDVILMGGTHVYDFVTRDQLANLSDRVAADQELRLDDYYQPPVDLFTIDGGLYGLPRDCNTVAIYYNKSLFEQHGVPLPTADWTWDDLHAAAEKLTLDENQDGRKDCWGFLAGYATVEVEWGYWIWQNGGEILNEAKTDCLIDQPAGVEAFKYLYSYVEQGLSPSPADVGAFSSGIEMFIAGRVAMTPAGSWGIRSFSVIEDFDWDIAPLPRKVEAAAPVNGLAYSIYEGSKHKDAAWKLAKFLVSEPAQRLLAGTGTSIPALRSVAESEAYLDGTPPGKQVFLQQLDYGRTIPFTRDFFKWETACRDQFELAWLGRKPIEAAVQEAAAAVDQILAAQPSAASPAESAE